MNKKLAIFFLCFLVLSTYTIHFVSHWIDRQYRDQNAQQARLLHEGIEERFELLLQAHLSTGILAARYLAELNFDTEDYEAICHSIVSLHPEIVGVNVVDKSGLIAQVCPYQANKHALNRRTQNLPQLQDSYKKGERYWFSSPFELYQRGAGFVFYIPVVKNSELTSWLALPMTFEKFFAQFKITTFLNEYHLIIKDARSDLNFFKSAPVPEGITLKEIHQSSGVMFGRDIVFYSWNKGPMESYQLSWIFCLIMGMIIAFLATYSLKVRGMNRIEKTQMKKIKSILELTAKEARSALAAMEKKFDEEERIEKKQIAGFVFYLNNLIDQTITTDILSRKSLPPERKLTFFQPLLQEQIELANKEILEKRLNLKFDQGSLKDLRINSHEWLFSHSVLGNILRYLIFVSPPGSDLQGTFFEDGNIQVISFHAKVAAELDPYRREILRRGLDIAAEVIRLSDGELSIIERESDKTIALQFRS